MTALAIVIVLAIPVLVLGALPWLVDLRQKRRQQVVSQQIALTDAIHAALGPIVAPVVRRGRRGWIGVLPMPAGHPQLARMVEIAQSELGPGAEVVLVTQEPAASNSRRMAAPAAVAA